MWRASEILSYIAIATIMASPASAERIFPSLPDPERSGTVELHLAWGAPGSPAGQLNGGNDQFGIFSTNPTGLRMGNVRGGGNGGTAGGCGCQNSAGRMSGPV